MIDETQSHDATPPTPDDNRWAAALKRPEPPAAKLRRRRERSQEKTLYAVPRRFDIATMLVVSLAYSILFTGLRLLDAPWQVFAYFGLLTVVVGVAQALFPYGNEPRWASIYSGFGYCCLWSIALGVLSGDAMTALCGVVGSMFFGPPLGYLMGAIEAGVFLVADKVRQRWFPDAAPDADSAADAQSPEI